jgi:hypothetical protein
MTIRPAPRDRPANRRRYEGISRVSAATTLSVDRVRYPSGSSPGVWTVVDTEGDVPRHRADVTPEGLDEAAATRSVAGAQRPLGLDSVGLERTAHGGPKELVTDRDEQIQDELCLLIRTSAPGKRTSSNDNVADDHNRPTSRRCCQLQWRQGASVMTLPTPRRAFAVAISRNQSARLLSTGSARPGSSLLIGASPRYRSSSCRSRARFGDSRTVPGRRLPHLGALSYRRNEAV